MKKLYLLLLLFLSAATLVSAQQKKIDSLKKVIATAPPDTSKIKSLLKLTGIYYEFDPELGLKPANEAYSLSVALNSAKFMGRTCNYFGNIYTSLGDYGKAMQYYFKGIALYHDNNDPYSVMQAHNNIGSTYIQRKEYPKAFQYLSMGRQELQQYMAAHKKSTDARIPVIDIYLLENMGEYYFYTHQIDSAIAYYKKGIAGAKSINLTAINGGFANDLGEVEEAKGNRKEALKYFHQGSIFDLRIHDISTLDFNNLSIARLYNRYNQPDSAIYYAKQSLDSARKGHFLQDVLDASKLISKFYEAQHDIPNAYRYYKMATDVNDSLFNQDKIRELVSIDYDEKQKQEELAAAQVRYQDKIRNYAFVVLLLIVFIFWLNSQQRKRANKLLHKQKKDIESTLAKLQLTQNQLVQSEKMASLGELTAGIAHEIQNPLNFVNNFSEVNKEMVDELEEALKQGNMADALAIAADIKQNEEKINHHGKRADSIVKGMLQHSRASSNTKEPTDINRLADEYLRLAYHGLRAKDKSFNADLVTSLSPNLPEIDMIPQDVGRVLLNLFNNAFYAVQKKQQTAGPDFKPTVELSTTLQGSDLIIKVKDNGDGIPDSIKEKIMQPFFTTKPTGEGTGLGLSLSYDIVVKGHGGNITVNSKENEFTEFVVSLPIT